MPAKKPTPTREQIVARILATIDRADKDAGPPEPGREYFWYEAHTIAHALLEAIFNARAGVNAAGMRAAVAAILPHVSGAGLRAALDVACEEEKFADRMARMRIAAEKLAAERGIPLDDAMDIIDREYDAKNKAA